MSRLSRIILTVRRGFINNTSTSAGGSGSGGEIITTATSDGISSAVHFYNQCIGLPIHRVTTDIAELVLVSSSTSPSLSSSNLHTNTGQQQSSSIQSSSIPLVLLTIRAIDGDESKLCTGYTPILTLEVYGIDTIISSCIQYGAQLDGPIQYPAYGKVATLRTPHGHIISLYEPSI